MSPTRKHSVLLLRAIAFRRRGERRLDRHGAPAPAQVVEFVDASGWSRCDQALAVGDDARDRLGQAGVQIDEAAASAVVVRDRLLATRYRLVASAGSRQPRRQNDSLGHVRKVTPSGSHVCDCMHAFPLARNRSEIVGGF